MTHTYVEPVDGANDERSLPDEHADAVGGARRWAEALPYSYRRELRLGERTAWRRLAARLVIESIVVAMVVLAVVGGGALALHRGFAPLSHAFGGPGGLALALLGLVGIVGACAVGARAGARLWPRLAGLTAAGLTVLATVLAPADSLSSLWLRTPWAVIVLLGTGTAALVAWRRAVVLVRLPVLLGDLRTGAVDVFANASARVDVLPRSKVVISRNGSVARRIEVTRTAEIAPPQPHAYRTDLPRGIVRASVDRNLRLQRRSLTSDERAELGAHIQRLRRAAWPALASVLAVIAVLGLRMAGDPDWRNLVDVVAIGWYALGAVACVGYARRFTAARKLAVDRDLRWVVTVDDAAGHTHGVARLEVLPISHLAWTEGAAPAPWRMHGA